MEKALKKGSRVPVGLLEWKCVCSISISISVSMSLSLGVSNTERAESSRPAPTAQQLMEVGIRSNALEGTSNQSAHAQTLLMRAFGWVWMREKVYG